MTPQLIKFVAGEVKTEAVKIMVSVMSSTENPPPQGHSFRHIRCLAALLSINEVFVGVNSYIESEIQDLAQTALSKEEQGKTKNAMGVVLTLMKALRESYRVNVEEKAGP